MANPTNMARKTADTLHTNMVNQIVDFLDSSARHGERMLTAREQGLMRQAADALREILSWQSPFQEAVQLEDEAAR